MSVTIQPFGALDTASVRDYLVEQSNDSTAIIEWKYFDASFNQRRERGFACVDKGRVCGALGLIPFTALVNGAFLQSAWSCDWSCSSSLPGPLGIMLMKQSLRPYPLIYSLGGSTQTRSIMPKLAQSTVEGAGVELHKPLRLGGAIRALASAGGIRIPKSLPLIDRFPLRFMGVDRAAPHPQISSDLRSALAPVLNQPARDDPSPAYDSAFIEWLLGRCPIISSQACTIQGESDAHFAILFWCQATDHRFWRIAVVGDIKSRPDVVRALREVFRYIMKEGGWMVSILTSRLDTGLLSTLKGLGFIAAQRRPLYVLSTLPTMPALELRRLSYLDTDYAYRFSQL